MVEVPKLKKAANEAINNSYLDYWNEVAKTLVVQGDFLSLLAEEEQHMTWQSFRYSLPKGVLGWAARAATQSLATPDNLFRWGKRVDSSCKLCKSPKCTLQHITNFCPVALKQSRFDYRHDSILNYMSKHIIASETKEVYFDLEGMRINGSTIPTDITTTLSRPDLVIVDRAASPPVVYLYELSVSYERKENTENAHSRKNNRYAPLVADIEARGFKCSCVCFEIGSRGYINNRNKVALGGLLRLMKSKVKFRTFYQQISKISLLCSFAIYCARNEPEWTSPRFLSP